MADVIVAIEPKQGVAPAALPASVPVEIVYQRDVGNDDAGQPLEPIQDTVRGMIGTDYAGQLTLPSPVAGTDAEIRFLSGSGVQKHVIRAAVPPGGAGLSIELLAADVATIAVAEPRPPDPPKYVRRDAQLVAIGASAIPFGHCGLVVAPVAVSGNAWKQLGLDKLFNLPSPATTAVELDASSWDKRDVPAWTPEHIAVDGRFTTFFPQDQRFDAWMWWLTGPLSMIGIVQDDLSKEGIGVASIVLPPLSAPPEPGGISTSDGRLVPADVTEREVAENPNIYTEDPGAFCKPFSNPERVLSERSFNVIYRAEQPVLSAEASIRTVSPPLLDFDLPELVDRDGDAGRRRSVAERVVDGLRMGARTTAAAAARTVRFPALAPFVIRDDLPAVLIDDWRRGDRGRRPVDAQHPVQWDADSSRYQAVTTARGHILEFRMRWRSNGYSLGTVAKTLTLAPRQVKRIQKIEWQRLERTRREERTEFVERASDSVSRERQYDDSVQASLSEWARGESESSSTAGAGGFGFATAGFIIGGGGGHSNANSSSSQEGGRRVTAAEEQRLQDTVRRYGDSLRRLESVVVNEVTQEETVTGTAEIVRNPNYGHALTVIYYQILRHLKVETAFAAVRECLFVPFAIKPFTIARTYRWRDLIQRGLLHRRFAPALQYLKDVLTGFSGSTVPPGRRSDQRVRHVSGSLYITLGVARPRDTGEGKFDEAAWLVLNPFLGTPAQGIFALLQQHAEARRDRVFQDEHAPRIASTWVNTIGMSAGIPLAADMTLATRYSFNGTVRVDFSASTGSTFLTREMLASIRVRAFRNLPPGSVANVTRLTVTYQTDQFQRTFSVTPGAQDLVQPETGVADSGGSLFSSIPDNWERQDVRAELIRAVNELVGHLNEHAEHYHKAIWWNMDRDRLFMLVDGFEVPGAGGASIGSVIERDPIAIMGNAIVFRVSAGSFLGIADLDDPVKLHNYYAARKPISDPLLVSLPTDGLYAQTIMDECLALEEHRGSTEWILDDAEPELPSIDPSLLGTRRTEPTPVTPTAFPQTLISLQNAAEAPAPTGLGGVLNAVTTADAFRDMAGLAGTQANAKAALETAASLATQFGAQAVDLKKTEMGTQTAKQKLDTIGTALSKGLVDEATAKKHVDRVLSDMNSKQPSDAKLSQEQSVRDFIAGASEVTATRSDQEGQQTIQAKRPGGNDPPVPPLDLDLDASILGWTDMLRLVPDQLRHTIEEKLSAGREEWLTANRPLRRRFPNEPATNLDGLPIPAWVNAEAVFERLTRHYDAQHAALTAADQNRNFTRAPAEVLGATPTNPITANYFVLHDTAGTQDHTSASNNGGVHLWLGKVSLARGGDWDAAGDATKLEIPNRTCFVDVELTRATGGAISGVAPNNYANAGISNARTAGTRYTDQQYDDLANAYIVASIRRGRFLTVTAHKEVDRSAVRRGHPTQLGHGDPEDLDVERFYRLVARKLVLPVGSTFGLTQRRVDSRNLDGHVNAFIDYARGNAPAANQYDWPIRWQHTDPTLPQGDSSVPPHNSTALYVMPLQDANGNNILDCGDGNWDTGAPA